MEGCAPAEDVGPSTQTPELRVLLGCGVARREDSGEGRGVLGRLCSRRPEVDQDRAALRMHQHVVWLEVAMQQPARVHVGQRARNTGENIDCICHRERPGSHDLGKRGRLDEFHGDVHRGVGEQHIVDSDDSRVVEPGEGLGLALKPVAQLGEVHSDVARDDGVGEALAARREEFL